jgi:hypothetical protein
MRNFLNWKAPLQVTKSEYAGWLYLSMEAMDPKEATLSANIYIKNNCEKHGRTLFKIACEWRMIWDDKAKSADLSVKEKQAKKAMHIICEKGRAGDVAPYIHAWLAFPRFAALTNIPMKFMPNFAKGQGHTYNMKFDHAIQKHMKLMAFGTRTSTMPDFESIDMRCPVLEG